MDSVYPALSPTIAVPVVILESKALSSGAKVAYALLLKYSANGSCEGGHPRLVADLDVTRQAVSRYIRELHMAGAIRVHKRGLGRTDIYMLPHLGTELVPMPQRGKVRRIARLVAQFNATCAYCRLDGTEEFGPDDKPWHADHVWAKAKGGPDTSANIVLACATCNLRKQQLSADNFLQKLAANG